MTAPLDLLSADDHQALARELAQLVEYRAAEQDPAPKRQTFLPQSAHQDVLLPARLLVLGDRGVGKSALFRLLVDPPSTADLRSLFDNPMLAESLYVEGFTEAGMAHPPALLLENFAMKHSGPAAVRALWMAHLLRQLAAAGVVERDDPNRWLMDDSQSAFGWMQRAPNQVVQLQGLLDEAERTLVREGRTVCVLYDQLDRIGAHHPEVQRRVIGTLLSLWLSLSQRYRALRGKIFLREDVFERTEVDFPDVSKLRRSQSVTLRWSDSDLFRVALRHVVALCPRLGAHLREIPAIAGLLRAVPGFGEIPRTMPEPLQREFLRPLAGVVVGEGMFQVYTSRWLLGAILDGRGQGAPRAMLSALGGAAQAALARLPSAGQRLLAWDDLREGARQAGLDRLRELREAQPVVQRLENLKGREVPVSTRVMERWLGSPVPGEAAELAEWSGAEVRQLLLRLGVLSPPDGQGRCDVPDLYLNALGGTRVAGLGREQERAALRRDAVELRFRGLEAAEQARVRAIEARQEASAGLPLETEPVLALFLSAAATLEEAIPLSSPPPLDVLITLAQIHDQWVSWLPVPEARTRLTRALSVLEPLLPRVQSAVLADEVGVLHEDLAFRGDEDAWVGLGLAAEHYQRAIQADPELVSPHLHLARNCLWRFLCDPKLEAQPLLFDAQEAWASAAGVLPLERQSRPLRARLKRVEGAVHQAWALLGDQWATTLATALTAYFEATQLAPNNPHGFVQQGQARLLLALREQPEERLRTLANAEADFRRALQLSYQPPGALAGLAQVAIRRVGWEQDPPSTLTPVQTQLERLEEQHPAVAVYPLACLHGLRGDHERSRHYLKRCQQLARLLPRDWLKLEPGLSSLV